MKKLQLLILLFVFTPHFVAQNESLLNLKSNLLVNYEINSSLMFQDNFEKKSAALAVLYSVLLPGMGELYAGNYSTGKYFTIADGVIWGFFSGFTIYGNNKESDYKSFAKSYGSVNLSGKDEEYFANISLYENIEDFNTEQELNREFDAVYNVNTHFWDWQNSTQRKVYRDLWSSSETAYRNVRFAVGALILNRVVSAIFAVKAVNNYNKQQSNQLSWRVNFEFQNQPNLTNNFKMNFQHSF
ncbi:MAG: hypothetical protein IPM32_08445 [Ignavibacteriae bacterium]|nr:hypothetical protein [Ignavibacteriota bacterium]